MADSSTTLAAQPAGEKKRTRITRESLREVAGLLAYLWPYKGKFVAALVALFFSSILSLAFPYVTGRLLDRAISGSGAEDPRQIGINAIIYMLLAALGVQAACSFFHAVWFAEVAQRTLADLSRDAFDRLIRLPMSFYSQRRVGELISRLSADVSQLGSALVGTIPQFLRHVAILAGGGALLLVTSVKLTLLMLSIIPPLIVVAELLGRRIRPLARDVHDRLAESSVIVEESLQGILNVKAFTNEWHELGRYEDGLRAAVTASLRMVRYGAAFGIMITIALFGAFALVLWYGMHQIEGGTLTAGELTRFMIYTTFVGGAMGSFAELYAQIQRAIGSTQRVRELLRETPELESATALFLPSSNGVPQEPRSRYAGRGIWNDGSPVLRGEVVFDGVTFSYPSRKEVNVLRSISLSARAGERVALVGKSGAGKSTIVALLLRLFDVDSGCLSIDGVDVREYGLHALRRQIAIVPQEVMLFGRSIAENIAYGKTGATESEVIEAARKANAHEFIAGFPEGYRTRVGERGIQLSGGQRQRVAIARAILKDPAILILDEATSSLDSETESLVQQALEGLMRGRTSIIIAHRLATVCTADRIFVIEAGETVESGTHAELIGRENGLYRTLSELQSVLR